MMAPITEEERAELARGAMPTRFAASSSYESCIALQAAYEARVRHLEDEREKQINYSIDLQRIIEDLCGVGELRLPQTTARHHYAMAKITKNKVAALRNALRDLLPYAEAAVPHPIAVGEPTVFENARRALKWTD